MNLLEYILFGILSGFSEFLPVSSEAQMLLLGRLFGDVTVRNSLRLAVHLGALSALILSCMPQISKLSREMRLAAVPQRRRKRQPDLLTVRDWRVLKAAGIAMLLGFAAYPWIGRQGARLWILCIGLVISGILLYVPQFLPGANKNARNVNRLDAVLIGLGGALGVFPGISRMGTTISVAAMRGCDREYSLHIALLLSVPTLAVLSLIDLSFLIAFDFGTFTLMGAIGGVLAGLFSAVSSYFGIILMRFLSVKVGFSAFAYYSWGAALFSFILYLLI